MKAKLIYSLTFLGAFILVTFVLVKLNSHYQNIFQFDFRPVMKIDTTKFDEKFESKFMTYAELKSFFKYELQQGLIDSIKIISKQINPDTVYQTVVEDSLLLDSLNNISKELKKYASEKKKIEEQLVQITQKDSVKENVTEDYKIWVKKTAKLYEKMDPKKAAKIILQYSDNRSRDIIYSMKKKSAAEILSEMNPENVNKIMSLN